jgi:transcriptional regulator with XRE-family HTH domain
MGTTVYVLGMSGFGDRLVATRKRLRVSQEALAVSAGMQRSHLSKIENGRITLPSDDVVSRLASALGISPDELYGTIAVNEDSPPYDAVTATVLQKTAHWTPAMKALLWRYVDAINDAIDEQAQ